MSDPDSSPTPQPQPDESGRPPRPPKKTERGLEEGFPDDEPIIDTIERRMRWRFPNAFTDRGENYVVFLPDRDDGFAVRLAVKLQTDGPQKFVINYGILSAETGDRDQAIETFAFGLSTDRRIREYSFGGVPSYWVVDHWDYRMKRWREGLEFILWRRLRPWRKSRLRFLQNHLIDFEDSAASCAA